MPRLLRRSACQQRCADAALPRHGRPRRASRCCVSATPPRLCALLPGPNSSSPSCRVQGQRLKRAERWLVQFLCQMFVVSWTGARRGRASFGASSRRASFAAGAAGVAYVGPALPAERTRTPHSTLPTPLFGPAAAGVIKYHGPRPVPQAGRVWVANHSSMIDFAVLGAYSPFAGERRCRARPNASFACLRAPCPPHRLPCKSPQATAPAAPDPPTLSPPCPAPPTQPSCSCTPGGWACCRSGTSLPWAASGSTARRQGGAAGPAGGGAARERASNVREFCTDRLFVHTCLRCLCFQRTQATFFFMVAPPGRNSSSARGRGRLQLRTPRSCCRLAWTDAPSSPCAAPPRRRPRTARWWRAA